jgi:hypothetical protein
MTINADMKKEMDIAQHSFAKGVSLGLSLGALDPQALSTLLRSLALLRVQSQTDTPHVKHLLKRLRRELSRQDSQETTRMAIPSSEFDPTQKHSIY